MKHEAMQTRGDLVEVARAHAVVLSKSPRAHPGEGQVASVERNLREKALACALLNGLCSHIEALQAALARARAEALEEAAQELDERAARLWALAKAHPEHEEMFSSGAADMEVMARAIRRLSERGGVGGASPAGWQPIATAPRDGTMVWLFEPHSMGGFMFAGVAKADGSGWRNNLDGEPQYPTHWMPLPQPPASCDRSGEAAETGTGSVHEGAVTGEAGQTPEHLTLGGTRDE